MIIGTNDICACYGLFILFEAGTLLPKVYPDMVLAIEDIIIADNNLDYYRRIDNGFHFYKSSYSITIEKKISKFRSANCINVLPYQKYPDILCNLTTIEKVFIACIHLIMSVIQLKRNKTSLIALYYWIWDYIVILSQNPGPLLIILSSSNLAPHDMICIAWTSKRPHTFSNICLIIYIQKTRVLKILCWLKTNNLLYKNNVINLHLLYI